MSVKIGIIGGSGLEDPELFKNPRELAVDTPWGAPSSTLLEGEINGTPVVLLSRHGREHTIAPTQVNYRANIHALKAAGCTHILATTAVGSLRQEYERGDFVVLDQFIDFTHRRKWSYFESFEPHNAKHTPMADPYDDAFRNVCIEALEEMGLSHHKTGTVITVEGPRFSTRAESRMYRILGADVVNMSVSTETILANELQIPYAAVAMVTDYDAWKDDEAPVTFDAILEVMRENAHNMIRLIGAVMPKAKKL